jgi:23S rRNA pseudouridine955/2504/2580 synthase
MSNVELETVSDEEAGIRLDRWFRRRFPRLAYGKLAKLIRTGQVRVDGGRAKPDLRLEAGQRIRVPPLRPDDFKEVPKRAGVSEADATFLRDLVLYKDEEIIAINKPPGLAVQGGTKTRRHVDAMLDALTFGKAERPRLVHRLDRDTSGVLLLARSAAAAARLAREFQTRHVRKVYWALCAGVPKLPQGKIDLPLEKRGTEGAGKTGERMYAATGDKARPAVTYYATLGTVGQKASWLALSPMTGRTHQLRVHCAAIGHPIVGDRKYGGGRNELSLGPGTPGQLCLHARSLEVPRPGRAPMRVTAPLPPHMARLWDFFEFDKGKSGDPFADLRD